MHLNDIFIIDSLPSIDLHGYDREIGRVLLMDFISDCVKLRHPFCVIVHGRGSGILRKMTDEHLQHNKQVKDFQRYRYNDGCTIVELNLTK